MPLERYQRWLQTLFRTTNLIPDGLIPYLKIRFQPIFKHHKNCTSSYRIKFYLNLILLGTKEKFPLQWRSTTLRQISLICEIAEIPQRCSAFPFLLPPVHPLGTLLSGRRKTERKRRLWWMTTAAASGYGHGGGANTAAATGSTAAAARAQDGRRGGG